MPRPFRLAPWCEKSHGIFLCFWGACLQLDHFARIPGSRFYATIEHYAPGWVWGLGMILLGGSRLLAYLWGPNRLRLALSGCAVALFFTLAAFAFFERLWGLTFPLSAFAAYTCLWCHRSLARDLTVGVS